MTLKLDYYRLLQVNPSVTPAELKKAYRQLAVAWHPDRNPGSPLAEERFKAISEAYAVLSDPAKRRHYDLLGPDKFSSQFSREDIFQGFEAADLFQEFGLPSAEEELAALFAQKTPPRSDPLLWQDFFAGFGQKPGPRLRTKSPNINIDLDLSLSESVYGTQKTAVRHSPQGPEKITVTVPPGVIHGQKLAFPRQGAKPVSGQTAGDLVVTISVRPDPDFSREGSDLVTWLRLTGPELRQGTKSLVRTLDGRTLRLTVKPGARPGMRLKVPGRGVPGTEGSLLITLVLSR
ncbi:MAG: DnaJ domain-containing protein [Deltaproteobacteria bacterium]|nr:DnaJ domain-containing protein [Deltaproteobacteria bacterium]